jgi:hypothetical protein
MDEHTQHIVKLQLDLWLKMAGTIQELCKVNTKTNANYLVRLAGIIAKHDQPHCKRKRNNSCCYLPTTPTPSD